MLQEVNKIKEMQVNDVVKMVDDLFADDELISQNKLDIVSDAIKELVEDGALEYALVVYDTLKPYVNKYNKQLELDFYKSILNDIEDIKKCNPISDFVLPALRKKVLPTYHISSNGNTKEGTKIISLKALEKYWSQESDVPLFPITSLSSRLEHLAFMVNCLAVREFSQSPQQYNKMAHLSKDTMRTDLKDLSLKYVSARINELADIVTDSNLLVKNYDVKFAMMAMTSFKDNNGAIALGKPSTFDKVLVTIIHKILTDGDYDTFYKEKGQA